MFILSKVWSLIEKNRYTVIVPMLGIMLWLYASIGCTPTTESPTRLGVQVNAVTLQQDFETWQAEKTLEAKKFEWAAADIEKQKQDLDNVSKELLNLASGSVTSWSGLLQILVSSGLVGFFADNLRKNGVIAGLKRNKLES